eukprot:13851828-Alexandrium_andersonii.AAC.1
MATASKKTSWGGGMYSMGCGKRTSACKPSSGASPEGHAAALPASAGRWEGGGACLLYTSDAADDM